MASNDNEWPFSYSELDSLSAAYPRIVIRWYAGERRLCLQTKRWAGLFGPRHVTVRKYGRHYSYVRPSGPPEPRWIIDLIPLDDTRPHWTAASPRPKPRSKR